MFRRGKLPARNIRFPFLVFRQMPSEDIHGIRRRFLGCTQEVHVRLFHFSAPFAVVAVRARRDDIGPQVLAAHMTRDHVIHCQPAIALPAVLAGIIITPEDLPAGQFDVGTRPVDLTLQPDDRWARDELFHRSDVTASIDDHAGFARQEQANRTTCRADIDRFEIGI